MASRNNPYRSQKNERLRPPWINTHYDAFSNQSNTPSMCASDEIIAKNEQENLYTQDPMDVDEQSSSEFGSLYNYASVQQSESDAAFALQLQSEEYSRDSLLLNRTTMNNNKLESFTVGPDTELFTSDAQLAEHLQAEENNRHRQLQHQQRRRPQQLSRSRQSNASETVRLPQPFRITPPRPRSNRNSNNNFSQLFRMMSDLSGPIISNRFNRIGSTNDEFDPNDYETLLQLDESIQPKGLTKEQINTLPTENCRETSGDKNEEKQCSICMEKFEKSQTSRRLPCLHLFHQECVDQWLKTKNECPVCRIKAV